MLKKLVVSLLFLCGFCHAGQMSFQTPTPTTGTGNWVLSNSPTFVTPSLGAALATSLGVNIAPQYPVEIYNASAAEALGIKYNNNTNGGFAAGMIFEGNNGSNATVGYGAIYGGIESNTVGSQSGNLRLFSYSGGGLSEVLRLTSAGLALIGYTADQGGAQKIQVNGNGFLSGDLKSRHLVGGSSTPAIAAGAGAGTIPTVSVSGNDTDMQVTITTGTTPTGSNATIATITYNATFGTTPHPTFSPANANSAALTGTTGIFVDGASATTYTIKSGATALTASTTYLFNVHTMN